MWKNNSRNIESKYLGDKISVFSLPSGEQAIMLPESAEQYEPMMTQAALQTEQVGTEPVWQQPSYPALVTEELIDSEPFQSGESTTCPCCHPIENDAGDRLIFQLPLQPPLSETFDLENGDSFTSIESCAQGALQRCQGGCGIQYLPKNPLLKPTHIGCRPGNCQAKNRLCKCKIQRFRNGQWEDVPQKEIIGGFYKLKKGEAATCTCKK